MPTTDAPDDRMADLQEALKTISDGPAPEGETETPDAAPAPVEGAAEATETTPEVKEDGTGRLHAKDGKFAAKAKEAPTKKPEAVKAPSPAAPEKVDPARSAAPKVAPVASPEPASAIKAPASWRPEVREKWATLPPEVQQEVARRERETQQTIQQAAGHRQEADGWRQVVAPYEMLFRADGTEAKAAVAGVLQMAAALRTGALPQKANILASLIKTYGVPPEAVADALDGKTPAGGGVQAPPEYRDPRVDRMLAHLEQQRRQSEEASATEARRQLEAFQNGSHPLAEFFPDLQKRAGRELQLAQEDGETLTLEQAFERAAQNVASVRTVLEQRKAAADAKAKAAEALKKRGAAGSIRSLPAGPPAEADESDGTLSGDLQLVTKRLAAR